MARLGGQAWFSMLQQRLFESWCTGEALLGNLFLGLQCKGALKLISLKPLGWSSR